MQEQSEPPGITDEPKPSELPATPDHEKKDRKMHHVPLFKLYNSLERVIDNQGNKQLNMTGFNVFCANLINSSVALQIIDQDPNDSNNWGKVGIEKLLELQTLAQQVRERLKTDPTYINERNEKKKIQRLQAKIISRLPYSPYVTPGIVSKYFGVEYKVFHRLIAGFEGNSQSDPYPPDLPSNRVGWQYRIPGASILLYEAVSRAHQDTEEMQTIRDRFGQGDLTAFDYRTGPPLYTAWSEYVQNQGLSSDEHILMNMVRNSY